MKPRKHGFKGQFRAHNHLIRNIVDELKQLREDQGYTQTEFAQLIGRNQSSISRFENFESYPSFDMVRDYAIALKHQIKINLVPLQDTNGSYSYTTKANTGTSSTPSPKVTWSEHKPQFT